MLSDTSPAIGAKSASLAMAYTVEVEAREAMARMSATLSQLKNLIAANSATIARHEGMLNGNRLTLVENRDTLAQSVEIMNENNQLLQLNNKLLLAVCASLGLEG